MPEGPLLYQIPNKVYNDGTSSWAPPKLLFLCPTSSLSTGIQLFELLISEAVIFCNSPSILQAQQPPLSLSAHYHHRALAKVTKIRGEL